MWSHRTLKIKSHIRQPKKQLVLFCLSTLPAVDGQQVESEHLYSITVCALWLWLCKKAKLSAHLSIWMLSNIFPVQKPSKTQMGFFIHFHLIRNKTKHMNTIGSQINLYELMNILEHLSRNKTLYSVFYTERKSFRVSGQGRNNKRKKNLSEKAGKQKHYSFASSPLPCHFDSSIKWSLQIRFDIIKKKKKKWEGMTEK